MRVAGWLWDVTPATQKTIGIAKNLIPSSYPGIENDIRAPAIPEIRQVE
jgi:hypothetical protein